MDLSKQQIENNKEVEHLARQREHSWRLLKKSKVA